MFFDAKWLKNAPKKGWLSFQAHPTIIQIGKWGPKRPQEDQKNDQGHPKWRAPKATPSDPKAPPRVPQGVQKAMGPEGSWHSLGLDFCNCYVYFGIVFFITAA